MKFKKLAATFLAFVLAVSSAACSTSSSSTAAVSDAGSKTAAVDDSATTSTLNVEPLAGADDPITFTVFVRDPSTAPSSDNPVLKRITELTGVTLKFEFLVGDIDQKLGVMIAGGDYPDAIFAGDSASKLIEAGAFIPLEDEIPKYENLNNLYKNAMKSMSAEDGHVYNMENYNVSDSTPTFQNGGAGFFIQKAVLAEFDYPTITTVEQYFKLIEDYAAKYPEIDGVKTIGFEVLSDGWRNWSLVNPTQHLLGAGNDGALYVDPNTFETSFFQTSDTAKTYLQQQNELYHKGLIQPETFTQSYDQYIARVSTGAVLGFFDQYWNFMTADELLKNEGKPERTYIGLPIANPGVKDGYLDAPTMNVTGVNGIGITTNCENPERLLAFYDWLLQREVQDYLQWGEEGVDFNYTEDDGKTLTDARRAINRDVAQKRDLTGDTLWQYCPKMQGLYEDGLPCGPGDSEDEYLAALAEYDKSFLGAYDYKYPAEMLSDPVVHPDYYPIWAMTLEDGSTAAVAGTKITDVTMKWYPRIILSADEAEFETNWTNFVAEFEEIDLASYQTEIDRQIALAQG